MGHVVREVREALARGGTVLTGRVRAAREIRLAMDEANRAEGLSGWTPARVFAWDSWTARLWREMLLRGDVRELLLNRTQEAAIWRDVVEADGGLASLRDTGSLAKLASGAWGDLARYGGLRRLAGSARNMDMETFARWAQSFEARCREGGYVSHAELEAALRRAWRGRADRLPKERDLLLVGFDRMLPAQAGVLDDLREAGCLVREAGSGELATARVLLRTEDEAGELRAAAVWARQVLEERPGASIGILVPALQRAELVRAEINRVFRAELAPELQVLGPGALPYEFSTGTRLGRTPIGRAAMALLHWATRPLAMERMAELLVSPHFAGDGQRSVRAEFEAYEVRRMAMLRPELTLNGLLTRVERSARKMPELLACLKRMQAVTERAVAGQKTFSDWAEVMRDLLRAAGWADGGLDSVWFQTREAWESVMDEMATLDFAGARASYEEAVEAVRGIAESTIFAAELHGAPVQIMGPEEAAGLRFDAIWFLRAGERSWPVADAGSPLVAWELRRELGMPGTDGAADMEQARLVTERIARSCGEIVFSYARQAGEEGERQRASAALSGLTLRDADAEPPGETSRLVKLEAVDDTDRLPALPDGSVAGGVGVLKAQAACAFHAFAAYRLFAGDGETPALGMNASERGRAVHGMLEHFWAEAKTQSALKEMTTEGRRAALGRAIDATLTSMHVEGGTNWDLAYLETQRERLMRLGMAWLVLEEGRRVPFTVERRESEQEDVAVGPLRLTLRLDRVDSTAEGAVLIDYKTGSANPSAWLTERPDEPQLPLYAALTGEMQLHAVAFGLVRAGDDMNLAGYESAPGTLKKTAIMQTGTLGEQVDAWREVVVGLAEAFASGDTRVSPKSYPGTCQYCAHRLICRLDAGSLQVDEDEAESEEEDRG